MDDNLHLNITKFIEKELKYIDSDDVSESIKGMNFAYSDLDSCKAAQLDFARRASRCGYVYRYFTCFTNAAKQALSELNDKNFFEEWFKGRKYVKITSLGGGPGTDLLAFYLFLLEIDVEVEITGVILDYFTEWHTVVQYLFKYYDVWNLYKLSDVEFLKFDMFSEPIDERILDEIRDSEIVTIVKFVSTIAFERECCENQLTVLLKRLKPDALLFFVDNSGGKYLELMTHVAELADLKLVSQFTHCHMEIPESEFKAINKFNFKEIFQSRPMQSCRISAGLWTRPSRNNE